MTPRRPSHLSSEEYRPPVPLDGCEPCRELSARRDAARTVFGNSTVSDANVLLRTHLLDDHSGT